MNQNNRYELNVPDTDSPVKFIIDLLKSGYENPFNRKGVVRIEISDALDESFDCELGKELLVYRANYDKEVDTIVSVPMKTIIHVKNTFEYADFRDPEIISTVKLDGDLSLADFLLRFCLRPNEAVLEELDEVEKMHEINGYRNLIEVERIYRPTQLNILESIAKGYPIVITGYSVFDSDSPWTLEKLVQKYKDVVVRVRSATEKLTMEMFVKEIQLHELELLEDRNNLVGFKPYTEGAILPTEMWDDFGPVFFERNNLTLPQLWFGSVPSSMPTSSLHRDTNTGFLAQYIGKKRLTLYSADQSKYLAPFKAFNNYQPCWFRPDDPDYSIFPLAKKSHSVDVVLSPGEILLQPVGWFHQVYAVDSPNMSVSYFMQ